MRTHAWVVAAVVGLAVGLACSGVDDPLPCGVGDDPPPCDCSLELEGGAVQGIQFSVPNAGFDGLRVQMIGPDTQVVNAALTGGSWVGTVHALEPGIYTLVIEGMVQGETDYFGAREGLEIGACTAVAPVTIAFASFRPAVWRLAPEGLSISLAWSAVDQADSYIVEFDSTYAFSTATQFPTADTALVVPVGTPGRYVMRIRADNALVSKGRPSDAAFMHLTDAATMTTEALMAHVEFLADDSLYGRAAGCDHEQRAADYVQGWFASAGLVPGAPGFFQVFPVTSGNTWWRCLPGNSRNVIGVLPGEGALATEWIVVGGHYDHTGWKLDGPDSSIVIFNGADDNASGTAAVIETARQIAEWVGTGALAGPRRSLLFQAFGAEEVGLIGSLYFVANPTVTLGSIAAMVNLDMVGRLRDNHLMVIPDTLSPWWEDMVIAANDDGLVLEIGADLSSDDWPFGNAGIPTVFFFDNNFDDYHSPRDDADRINAEGLQAVAALSARVVRALVTTEVLAAPPRR